MPYSDQSNIEWTRWLLNELQPKTIIDVGSGAGKYGQIAREILPKCHTTAVEIWAPYIKEFNLEQIYDRVDVCDGRIYPYPKVDLIIFGDVLEHLSKEDALALWKRISKKTKYAMISIPVVHYPQGNEHGNPYETHIEDYWTHEDILETFLGITGHQVFGITASYIADFTQ